MTGHQYSHFFNGYNKGVCLFVPAYPLAHADRGITMDLPQ